jgi:hypothetical protein
MPGEVRIGCWSGFWGDSPRAAAQIVRGARIDYLVGDHLAEVTMALLARARAKDPEAGYVPDVVAALGPLLADIHERGVKVVTNAGGLNPAGCAQALRAAAARAGVPLRVACVEGDDVSGMREALHAAGARDMFTGEPLPGQPLTMNAYLGARPIATALGLGAEIVVTGRCADSAVVLGPLMHEFGWSDDDHDLLSAGTLVGHIVECGPQALGGLFTDWWMVPGWEDMGYPIAECSPDGTAIITKPAGTGGMVTPATVAEQVVYEIGDPGAYVMPDVVCDWRGIRLEQDGPDRVCVSGARGAAPTSTYKVTTTSIDGFRVLTTALFTGVDAAGRARRAGEAILARAERIAGEAGFEPFPETSVEVVGAGDAFGRPGTVHGAREAVLKLAARHPDRGALDVLAGEMISIGLVAQGMTGLTGGRPKPAPRIRLTHLLLDKDAVPVTVTVDGECVNVEVAPGVRGAPSGSTPLLDDVVVADEPHVTVALRRVAYARSGDKGDNANIGVIARRPEFANAIRSQVTSARVAEVFAHWLRGPVHRWELPGIDAINLLLEDVLGGTGGTSSLRYDPQGKSYAAILLDLPVEVPVAWEQDGLLADAGPEVRELQATSL